MRSLHLARVAPVLLGLLVLNGAALSASSCSCGSATDVDPPTSSGGGGVGGVGGVGHATGGGGAGATGGEGGSGGVAQADGGVLPDVLPDFSPEELEPTTPIDGIPAPLPGVYTDLGAADLDASFRALMGFPIRDEAVLEQAIMDIYNPAGASFRDYFTRDEWMAAFAPFPIDLHLVKLWIESQGMAVNFTASNRLLFQFTGTVEQFNDAFQTELRLFERENPQAGNPPIQVYGTLGPLTVPTWLSDRITGIVTCDLPASTDPLPGEGGQIENSPPTNINNARTPAKIAHAYDVDDLYALGYHGEGVKLGVVVGAAFKFKDVQSYWQSMGVNRTDPQVILTMELPSTRYLETTLDTEWAGAIAPASDLLVYEGPDAKNTSMVYTFNEAISRNEVSVISDSFAHREDSEPRAVRDQYHHAARMAAALGITVIAATGDSGQTDTPSSSPYVTGAGGTRLSFNSAGEVTNETAWANSGSGATLTFPIPWWQVGIVADSDGKRAVADVALNASPQSPLWIYYLGTWEDNYGGTSFSSPIFAGMVAVINSYRAAQGLPRLGWLNSILYQTPAVQAAFRDVVSGQTAFHAAGPGWDYPTGWGAPKALDLALALP